jgi:hypothetical protein
LLLRWAWRSGADNITFALFCIGLIGNVSLLLYLRQARYYAPMIFLSVAMAYSYWHLTKRKALVAHALIAVLLLASNYLAYAAWTIAMVVDYFIWGRKRRPIRGVEWLMLLGPQVLFGTIILLIWNPLRISTSDPSSDHGWLIDRFILLWRTLRDADRCEYTCAVLIVLAVAVAIWKKNVILIRALVALVIGFLVIDFASPQSPRAVDTADVRYFASLIPLAVVICVITLRTLAGRFSWVALLIAPVAFFSNLLDPSSLLLQGPRVTLYKFVHELCVPVPDPYTAVIAWLDQNLHAGDTVVALQQYCTYPLMFHAPLALYGWQLMPDQKKDPQFASLPPIHFIGEGDPDVIIAFGPAVAQVIQQYHPPAGVIYLPTILDVYYKDAFRPELMWRTFDPISPDKDHGTAIYIFKKQAASTPTESPAPTSNPVAQPPQTDFHL